MPENTKREATAREAARSSMADLEAEDTLSAATYAQRNAASASANTDNGAKNIHILQIRAHARLAVVGEAMAAKIQKATETLNAMKDKCKKVIDDESSSNREATVKLADDLKKQYDRVVAYLGTEKKVELEALKKEVDAAESMATITNITWKATEFQKGLSQGPVKEWLSLTRQLNMMMIQLSRKASGGRTVPSARPNASIHSHAKPPLWSMLMETFRAEGQRPTQNCTDSVFEVKGGARAYMAGVADARALDRLFAMPVYKRSVTKLTNAMKRNATPSLSDNLQGGKGVMKKLEEQLAATVGLDVISRRTLPSADWAKKVFPFTVMNTGPIFVSCQWCPFGMMQASLVQQGDLTVVGVRSERIPGATYREKRTNVMKMPAEQVQEMCNDGGFFAEFIDGTGSCGETLLIVPSGFLVITAAASATILNWSVAADEADWSRVKMTLKNLIESFPEYRNADTSYAQFAQFLGISF